MRRVPRFATILLLCFLFATNVYRARTQSFTADEALTYNNYVSAPLRATLTEFDANNHVLNTLLEKLAVAVFPVSELTLRLPSLAGGALFLAAVFVLCRRLSGDGVMLPVTVATMALNPFMLDFLSVARGYGMALGLFLWATEFVLRYFDQGRPALLFRASVLLGLAVAANLTLAFPGVALVVVAAAALLWRREWRILLDHFLLPGLLVAFVLLAIPLSYAQLSNFYVGTHSLAGTLESFLESSLFHCCPEGTSPREEFSLLRHWLVNLSLPLAPAVLALSGTALAWLVWRRSAPWPLEQRCLGLIAGTFAGSIALLVAVNRGLGLLYPTHRTGLYLIPLFWLACFALLRLTIGSRWPARILAPPCVVVFALYAFQFARQWNTKYYLEWIYDDRTREIIGMIDERRDRSRTSVAVSVTWPVATTVEFYKRSRRLDWLQLQPRHLTKEPADYYILTGDDREVAERLDVVFRDDLAGVVLARSIAPPRP